jgi:signal transduction histidine kinase/predicted negative regulator of RcsB-dependent stress response
MEGDFTIKHTFVGILCLLLAAGAMRAAQTPPDTLAVRLQTLGADTNRVNTLTALAERYRNTAPNKALGYASRALRLAGQLGFGAGRARALDHLGWSYYRLGELDKALSFSLQALHQSQAAGYGRGTVNASINVASIYYEQNNYPQAIAYFHRALQMSSVLDDDPLTGRALNNLGFLYFKQGDYPQALRYATQALHHNRRLADAYLVSFALRTLGDVYARQGHYDKALSCQSEALAAARTVNNQYMVVTALNRLGDLYARRNDYPRAIRCQQEALDLALAAGFRPDLVNIYASLAGVHARTGNFGPAYRYQQAEIALKDSIYNERSRKEIAQLQTRFETRRKEQENRLLRAENEKKQALLGKHYWTALAGLACSLLLAGTSAFFFLANRHKKQVNRLLKGQQVQIVEQNHQLTRLNQEVSGQNHELAQLNRVKNQFLSIISHDVRAPLTSLQGVLSLVHLDVLSKAELQLLLDRIAGQVQQNLLLLDNLLHWTSYQADGLRVHRTDVDLRAIAQENVDLYAAVAEQKGIAVHCAIAAPLPVHADAEMIRTVVRNLVNNAVKFTPAGGTITLRGEAHPGRVQFTVQDSGVGIPPERLAHLFDESAESTPGTGQEKGKGLGLRVCREFIHHHQGKLWAESVPGEGSAFHFTLPV